jgi:hypothetical protein
MERLVRQQVAAKEVFHHEDVLEDVVALAGSR